MIFDSEKYKQIALKILSPIKPADKNSIAEDDFLFRVQRSEAGRNLPEYFLVYFLLNDLLGFQNLGKYDKIAWSFPIDYKGKAFLIEFRKFGVGVFVQDKEKDEIDAEIIVKKINSAIKNIEPFYDYLAAEAIKNSKFNIVNNNQMLYHRFQYLSSLYKQERDLLLGARGIKKSINEIRSTDKNLSYEYQQHSNWLAISCIDAFFSWTEHLFIHLAVITQGISTGENITKLIEAEWKTKYQAAIKDSSKDADKFYNELLIVRQQLRNFIAHGAFGKNGNAFRYHSETGAVPVIFNSKKPKNRFSLYGGLTFKDEEVIKLIEEFIQFLWKGPLAPAMYYTQECELPTILTLAADGTYAIATTNMQSMQELTDQLIHQIDISINMDW